MGWVKDYQIIVDSNVQLLFFCFVLIPIRIIRELILSRANSDLYYPRINTVSLLTQDWSVLTFDLARRHGIVLHED